MKAKRQSTQKSWKIWKNGTKSSFNVTATAEWNQLLCVVLRWLLWDKHVLVGQLRSKTFRGPLTAAARAISSPFTSAGWRVPTFIIVEESERRQWSREAHVWLMTVILRTCYSVQIWWGNMVATKNHKPALIINALKIHKLWEYICLLEDTILCIFMSIL